MKENQEESYEPYQQGGQHHQSNRPNQSRDINKFYQVPPDPPKKALCPFFLYRMDIYQQIKIEHPNLRITEITRIIGDMWKELDPKLKERYEQQYQLNRKTASQQKKRYELEYGRQAKSRRSKKVKRAMAQLRRFFDHD